MKTMYFLLLSLIITNQAYSLGDQAALATDPHADAYFQRFVGEYSSKQRGCGGLEASVRFRYLGNGLATILVKDFGGLSHTAFFQCRRVDSTCTMIESGSRCRNVLFHLLSDGTMIARSTCSGHGIIELYPPQLGGCPRID